jgi:hypothetical protein
VAVDPAVETRSLEHRADDDNRRRHAGIYALCDWLAGSDMQWLCGVAEDNAYYSHVHGYYLAGPEWTQQSLAVMRNAPFALSIWRSQPGARACALAMPNPPERRVPLSGGVPFWYR